MSAPDLKTVPVNFIRFHGLTLLVVENGGVEFVPLKPLSDLVGTDWRSAKSKMKTPENVDLYGAAWLIPPAFSTGHLTRNATSESLYIRLDRAWMYLARINTALMRAHGNDTPATVLLTLQIEWAETWHRYKTSTDQQKSQANSDRAILDELIEVRELSESAFERTALTTLICRHMREMGLPSIPGLRH